MPGGNISFGAMSEKLKLLICSPFVLKRELGAPKVLIEVAEELRKLNWEVTLVDQDGMKSPDSSLPYEEKLKRYLRENSDQYDVVEYDHEYQPYPRKEFPQHPLFVARSVLLALHYRKVKIPRIRRGRDLILDLVRSPRSELISDARYERCLRTLRQADFVNLSTTKDVPVLAEAGIDTEKTAVFPYGLSEDLVPAYQALSTDLPSVPCIAFVGSFDERKGGADLPRIFNKVARAIPGVRLRLLGTAGVFQTTDEVRNLFPLHLRRNIEVYPRYVTEALPGLLEECSVGVFPSYLEGFGFAVLEMLAAGLPVATYDVPGPCDIVTAENRAAAGDWEWLADRLISLLKNPEKLVEERKKAKERSKLFRWKQVASDTDRAYREAVKKHREKFKIST